MLDKDKPSSEGNNFIMGGHGNISAEPLQRKLQTVTIYVHELLDIKKDIKKGLPLDWGLRLFWSIFCLCAGNIVNAALTISNFGFKTYIHSTSVFFQLVLALSFFGSILLLLIRRSAGSASEGIDQILSQCSYEKKK